MKESTRYTGQQRLCLQGTGKWSIFKGFQSGRMHGCKRNEWIDKDIF